MSLYQPLTVEVIPRLNEHTTQYQEIAPFEYYDVRSGGFIEVDDIRAHRIPFPPDQIPVFRIHGAVPLLSGQNKNLGGDLARGNRQIGPMCSMKHMLMEYKFIWPVGLLYQRQYLSAPWFSISWDTLAVRVPEGDERWNVIAAPL